MCGIVGYAGLNPNPTLLKNMTDSILHRGPDDEGTYLYKDVGLAMRRLSIIDIKGGKQPVLNHKKTQAIVFNGEIYNFLELRKALEQKGFSFATRSDTEVILALYQVYGPKCVDHLRGMFTFAIYDQETESLFIARDRLGVKPLYYWEKNGVLVFASEIKALLNYAEIVPSPNLSAIHDYLSLRYVPGPDTMFEGIRKFPHAHTMHWRQGKMTFSCYWTPRFGEGPYKEDAYYYDQFEELFNDAVKSRLLSEVPLGAFLSGGTDSTAIVSAMRKISNSNIKTFSIGFNWAGDELGAARDTAEKLETQHREIICTSDDLAQLPKIIWHLDEPVGDAITIPMYLLAKTAKESVSVVLTGEGADEALAGYFPHKVLNWTSRYQSVMPQILVSSLARGVVQCAPAKVLGWGFHYPAALGQRGKAKLLDFLSLIKNRNLEREYEFLISLFDGTDKKSLYSQSFLRALKFKSLIYPEREQFQLQKRPNKLNEILSLQYAHWLPDDILMKQDKMTMAHSIEARGPFLDTPLIEFLFRAPPHLKLSGFKDKVLLRHYLEKNYTRTSAKKPKAPFYIPVDGFFQKGPLKEILNICLSETSVKNRGYFRWEFVQSLLRAQSANEFIFGKQVFSLVCLELWHRIFIDREKGWI